MEANICPTRASSPSGSTGSTGHPMGFKQCVSCLKSNVLTALDPHDLCLNCLGIQHNPYQGDCTACQVLTDTARASRLARLELWTLKQSQNCPSHAELERWKRSTHPVYIQVVQQLLALPSRPMSM